MNGPPAEGSDVSTGAARLPLWAGLAWHGVAALTVALVPSQLRLGLPFWELPPELVPQVAAMVAAYFALALGVGALQRPRARLVAAVAGGALCFGAAYGALMLHPELQASRWLVLVSTALGIGLVVFRHAVRRPVLLVPGALLALLLVPASGIVRGAEAGAGSLPYRVVTTVSHAVMVRVQEGLVERPASDGGGIVALEDGYLVVTGEGRFYRLRPAERDSLRAEPLATPSPLHREEYLASQTDPALIRRLRATDLLIDTVSAPARALVAHQAWDAAGKCFTMRVSATPLDGLLDGSGAWETLYDTRPCIPVTQELIDIRTGGRLALDAQGRIFLSLGDHGYDGFRAADYPQSSDADYGKVLALGGGGTSTVMSRGHRNPQGLTVDRQGRLWETEHGPEGGDELNLVTEGGNYGWPLATYGTDYVLEEWPLSAGRRDHGEFVEPVHAFVPSIGASDLIEVGPGPLTAWEGDLLLASLRAESLFRVRMRDGRVTFVEPVRIRRRIRDLAQGSDGAVVMWTDVGDVVVLRAADPTPTGERLFAMCAGCHAPGEGGGGLGPDLAGVVGRRIASVSGFDYSPALRAMEGSWTDERLDAFLRDPAGFVPGTRMEFGGLRDAGDRRLLLDYLSERR